MKKYVAMRREKKQKHIAGIYNLIYDFLHKNKYDEKSVNVDIIELSRIVDKVHQREKYFAYFHGISMSELKRIALNCFWIIKLHPISIANNLSENDKHVLKSINEKFAVYYLIVYLKALYANKINDIDCFFDGLYKYELIYSFTYRDISKEAMILLVETIAKGIGIQPYREKDV